VWFTFKGIFCYKVQPQNRCKEVEKDLLMILLFTNKQEEVVKNISNEK